MEKYQELIETYQAADEMVRMDMYLSHREMRSVFIALESREDARLQTTAPRSSRWKAMCFRFPRWALSGQKERRVAS